MEEKRTLPGEKRKSPLLKELAARRLYLDGGMGSLMQERAEEAGLPGIGTVPEFMGITHPQLIQGIHRDYVKAGADIVLSCTFGANRYKLGRNPEYSQQQIVEAAMANVRAAGARYAAIDVGPIGSLIGELGDVSEEDAYEMFRELMVAGEQAGADLVVIETMTDLVEARIALLAARENTSLPVLVSMTFEENGRTLTGSSPEVCAVVLESLGADIIGTNCSTGPEQMLENAKKMMAVTSLPVCVEPNAGLPVMRDGKTCYDIDSERFSDVMKQIAEAGASVLGGCCGTEPEHIRKTCEKTRKLPYPFSTVQDIQPEDSGIQMAMPGIRPAVSGLADAAADRPHCTSQSRMVTPGERILMIGEGINPTADPKLKETLQQGESGYAAKLAIRQKEAGADILDINVGVPGIDEKEMMEKVIRAVTAVCDLPLQIDSTDPEVIERALRVYPGRAIVNSVNGDPESMKKILPAAARYGALLIGLALDENGIPETADQRLAIVDKLVREAALYGIPRQNLIIDALVMTASTQQDAAPETLEAVRRIHDDLGLATTLGVSNISFGLPHRGLMNRSFLAAALQNGLDTPILSVMDPGMTGTVDAFRVLKGEDRGCAAYTRRYMNKPEGDEKQENGENSGHLTPEERLIEAVADGLKEETLALTEELLQTSSPMVIVNQCLIPGLDKVGDAFETGEVFLPNLLFAAEAVQSAFERIKADMDSGNQEAKGTVLLATVEGDVHDIGKNILKVIMENYGYDIIDLGKDVPVQTIVDTVTAQSIGLVGLSALMTTTVRAMKDTIEAIKAASPETKVMVGGAVLTPEYAEEIGADYYGRDAKSGVDIAREVFGR
ncbi:MAG: homocysteine S-methyltransferase family protein [Eubacteriaceae bacterium]|jgi:5-methyltetrahydrofolate--homocysteine methyltransferase